MSRTALTGRTGTIKRNLKPSEHSHSLQELPAGTIVFEFLSDTFGVVTEGVIPVSLEPNSFPFFVVPEDSVDFQGVQ